MRMGFTLSEVRTLTMADFLAFTDVFYGEEGGVKRVRRATQDDIDEFMR